MTFLGTLLKNRRAGETHLAWHLPGLAGPDTIQLRSDDFAPDADIPRDHAGRRAGGRNLSPALSWDGVPAGTARLLLVIEDVDAPTRLPIVHGLMLLDPTLTALPRGGLNAQTPAPGVRLMRSTLRRGYLGPEPVKGHGPHRYVFQLFALAAPLAGDDPENGEAGLEDVKPRSLLDTIPGPALARGRLDGLYTR